MLTITLQRAFRTTAMVASILSLAGSAAGAERTPEPGEGFLCLYAISLLVDRVGPRCFPGRDAAFQSAFHGDVARMAGWMRRNSGWPAEKIERFEHKEDGHDVPDATFCSGDGVQLDESFRAQGAPAFAAAVDAFEANPGPPSWGTCF